MANVLENVWLHSPWWSLLNPDHNLSNSSPVEGIARPRHSLTYASTLVCQGKWTPPFPTTTKLKKSRHKSQAKIVFKHKEAVSYNSLYVWKCSKILIPHWVVLQCTPGTNELKPNQENQLKENNTLFWNIRNCYLSASDKQQYLHCYKVFFVC